MTPKPTGVEVTVSNRQRRRKINTHLLARIAERTLELVGDNRATLSIVLVDDTAIAKFNGPDGHIEFRLRGRAGRSDRFRGTGHRPSRAVSLNAGERACVVRRAWNSAPPRAR
jgi:hypothetical protein